jgi:hypothetical protein
MAVMALPAMVGDALAANTLEAVAACAADRGAAAFVLVIWSDVADAGVQATAALSGPLATAVTMRTRTVPRPRPATAHARYVPPSRRSALDEAAADVRRHDVTAQLPELTD